MAEIPGACLAFDEDLSALIDQELDPAREAELRAHIDSCSRCHARLQQLCNVDLALANLSTRAVPDHLRALLRQEIAAQAPRSAPEAASRRRAARRVPAAAWAALAAAVALALTIFLRSDEPTPEATPIAHEESPPASEALPPQQEPAPLLARTPQPAQPDPAAPQGSVSGVPAFVAAQPALAGLAEEDLALVVDLDDVEDLDVIANLDLLERWLELEERGAG